MNFHQLSHICTHYGEEYHVLIVDIQKAHLCRQGKYLWFGSPSLLFALSFSRDSCCVRQRRTAPTWQGAQESREMNMQELPWIIALPYQPYCVCTRGPDECQQNSKRVSICRHILHQLTDIDFYMLSNCVVIYTKYMSQLLMCAWLSWFTLLQACARDVSMAVQGNRPRVFAFDSI